MVKAQWIDSRGRGQVLDALVLAATCSSLNVFPAKAGGFAIRDQSAYGEGAAFAGVAAGGRLSTMFWNPAVLGDVNRLEIEAGAMGLLGDVSVKLDPQPSSGFAGSDEGNAGRNAIVPAGYGAYRIHDRIVAGVGVTVPFGLESRYGGSSVLNRSGIAGTSRVLAVNVNPVLSVDLTDWLSVGLGAQIQHFHARLSRQALGPLGISTLEGDDVALSFTAGIRLEPLPGMELGLGYRSGLQHRLDGSVATGSAGTLDVHYDNLDLPATATFGLRQRLTNRFRLLAGAEWTNWSSFGTVDLSGTPAPIALPFQYEDSWYFSLGGEYEVTPWASLRAGAGYQLSPIDDRSRSYRLPYNESIRLSVGATYRHSDHLSLDVGYSYVSVEDMQLRSADDGGPAANGAFSGRADVDLHFLSLAMNVHW